MHLLLTLQAALAAPIVRMLPAAVYTLLVEVDRGSLTIRHDPSAHQSLLTVTPRSWPLGCGLQLAGDRMHATARVVHDAGASVLLCRADVSLVLAGQTALTASVAVGTITSSHTPGHQDLRVSTGQVTGSIGRGSVRVGQGRVSLSQLTQALDASVHVGHIQLEYLTPPRGTLHAQADMGNVTVTLPAESVVDAQVQARMGIQEQHIPTISDASVTVYLASQLGSARLLSTAAESNGTR